MQYFALIILYSLIFLYALSYFNKKLGILSYKSIRLDKSMILNKNSTLSLRAYVRSGKKEYLLHFLMLSSICVFSLFLSTKLLGSSNLEFILSFSSICFLLLSLYICAMLDFKFLAVPSIFCILTFALCLSVNFASFYIAFTGVGVIYTLKFLSDFLLNKESLGEGDILPLSSFLGILSLFEDSFLALFEDVLYILIIGSIFGILLQALSLRSIFKRFIRFSFIDLRDDKKQIPFLFVMYIAFLAFLSFKLIKGF